MKCLYPECKNVPRCYADNPVYYIGPGHSEWTEGVCEGSEYSHKWICKQHWNLLEFIRLSEVFEFDVQLKRR